MSINPNKKTLLNLYPPEQLMYHAAVAYSNLWFRKDRTLYRNAQNTSFDKLIPALVEIAAAYKVSRNLPKNPLAKDVKAIEKVGLQMAWEKIATEYCRVELADFEHFSEMVNKLATTFQKENAGTPLSATSKLLWFKFRFPIRIFDTRACTALWMLGVGNRIPEHYRGFCDSWDRAFGRYKVQLEDALLEVGSHLCQTLVPPDEQDTFSEISKTDWFRERTFDQFLWLLGDDGAEEEVGSAIKYAPERRQASIVLRET